MEIAGTTAVVTGGGNGIGRAVALELAARGAHLAVADLEAAAAEATAKDVQAHGVRAISAQADVAREADVLALAERAWSELGSAQLLFNIAGVLPPPRPLVEMTNEDFRWVFDVNVGGTLNGIRAFAPRFIEAGVPARIINTGSEHSFGVPHVFAAMYTGSKHAILGISDVLRREMPPHVGVSVVCPGFVASTLWKSSERRSGEHGSAESANPAAADAMQAHAMPVEGVAKHIVDRVEADDFLIVTHPHVADIARARWEDAQAAFAAQAPRYDGDDQYDVNQIIAKVMGGGASS